MKASEALSFFPTFVWKIQLTSKFRQRVNANVLHVINQIKPDWAELPPGASWQSGQGLHIREELVDLVLCLDSTAQTVLRFLKIGHNAIDITGCWANISARGASHAIHSHPNNFLSGIYYVRMHPGAAKRTVMGINQ